MLRCIALRLVGTKKNVKHLQPGKNLFIIYGSKPRDFFISYKACQIMLRFKTSTYIRNIFVDCAI